MLQSVNGYWYILIITLIILVCLIVEAIRHAYYLKQIPIRIHVNGTRGKSSVTRLIAAGLRGGGVETFAKTTGTVPRLIFPDGHEEPIFRIGHTNIVEQIKVVRKAVQAKARALVIECMAVHPLLQSLAELKLVRSTHGVLTNARPDHLDVMGPTEEDVALALAGTMPVGGLFFTTENKYIHIFKMAADDRDSQLVHIDPLAAAEISDQDMSGFSYAEFKENVALALTVCQRLGINREAALLGMWAASPDPGALSMTHCYYQDHEIIFANGFAANDPLSTWQLWHDVIDKYGQGCEIIAVVNCRNDRKHRSVQMAEAIVSWRKPDRGFVIGSGTEIFIKTLAKNRGDLSIWSNAGDWSVKKLMDQIVFSTQHTKHLIIGIVNIAGIGLEFIDFIDQQKKSYE